MTNETTIFGRHIQKHDVEANWIKAGNAERPFIPKQAEFIVYDKDDHHDYERYKIGDGITPVNDLPFADANKQDKLPVNKYSSESTIWCVTPPMLPLEIDGITYTQGIKIEKDKYDEFIALENDPERNDDEMFVNAVKAVEIEGETKYYYVKPYYLKRLSKNSPTYGIITHTNIDEKLQHMIDIEFIKNDTDGKPVTSDDRQYVIDHIATHEEPVNTTIAVRREDGSLVVECPNDNLFLAVNNKKLNEKLNEKLPLVDRYRVMPTAEQRSNKSMKGWYRIAETNNAMGNWSTLFHVNVEVHRGNCASDIVFVAERQHKNDTPAITILTAGSNVSDPVVVPKMRIVYKAKDSAKVFLDVYVDRNPTSADNAWGTNNVAITDPACYDVTVQSLFRGKQGWNLWNAPQLVAEDVNTDATQGYTTIEKEITESSWSEVTTPVSDLNNVATKTYVDESIENSQVMITKELDNVQTSISVNRQDINELQSNIISNNKAVTDLSNKVDNYHKKEWVSLSTIDSEKKLDILLTNSVDYKLDGDLGNITQWGDACDWFKNGEPVDSIEYVDGKINISFNDIESTDRVYRYELEDYNITHVGWAPVWEPSSDSSGSIYTEYGISLSLTISQYHIYDDDYEEIEAELHILGDGFNTTKYLVPRTFETNCLFENEVLVDSELSEISTNPVQNKAITIVINDLLTRIAFLENKLNPSESAIYFGVGNIEIEDITVDFINSLETRSQATRNGNFVMSPDNQYVYFAIPKSFCVNTYGNDQVVFTAGIFDGGFKTPRSMFLNNTEYYIYRSINLLTWNDLTITIS